MFLLGFSLIASALFVVLVVAVHWLKPEIDPRWRMLSELAIGRHGWVMNVAFVAWSVSNLSLAAGLWPLVLVWAVLSLGFVSLGPLGAAFAVTDPITIAPEDQSQVGRVHTAFGMLFIFGFPLVTAAFALWSVASSSPLWPWLCLTALLVWAGLINFIAVTARLARAGAKAGPQSPIGIPNRWFSAAYVAWTTVIALAAMSLVG